MATDGLVAEREQGITIDVAHIYFSTENRSYVIADTPGHTEYTRNMVTGASTSQVSIILIDARKGVVEQTKRHFYINNLLRIKDVVVAVNKMDLIGFSELRFKTIKKDIIKLSQNSDYPGQNITFVPISALHGDNVVSPSKKMTWYKGQTIMAHLERIELSDVHEKAKTRFPVQTVIRPKSEDFHDFRGYAGKLYGGDLAVGHEVTILPSLTKSKVKSIHFFNQEYDKAERGSSITLTLEDEVNVSRGDMIVKSSELPRIDTNVEATICWMDTKLLSLSSKYIIQHGVNQVMAKITSIKRPEDSDFFGAVKSISSLQINEIGLVQLKLNKAIYFDRFQDNKSNGSFILIDLQTNTTAGVGFIN